MLCINHGISAEAAPVVTAHRSSPTPELTVRVSGSASGSRVSRRPDEKQRAHANGDNSEGFKNIPPHTDTSEGGAWGFLRSGTVTQEKLWRGTDRKKERVVQGSSIPGRCLQL